MKFTESDQSFQCKFGDFISLSEQEKKDIQEQAYQKGYQDGLDGKRTIKQWLTHKKNMQFWFKDATDELLESQLQYDDTENVVSLLNLCGNTMYVSASSTASTLLTKVPHLNFENVENMSYAFSGAKYITDFSGIDFSKMKTKGYYGAFNACVGMVEAPQLRNDGGVTTLNYAFYHCTNLRKIPRLNCDGVTSNGFGSVVEYCTNLEEVWFYNIRANLKVGSGTSWGHLLTYECLVHLIGELIQTTSNLTLTIGSANLAKLANTYVRLVAPTDEEAAQDRHIYVKHPFEICESTDEGAILITNYAKLKNWTLA